MKKVGDVHEETQLNFILLCSSFVSWLCGGNLQKCEQRYKNVYQSLIMAYTNSMQPLKNKVYRESSMTWENPCDIDLNGKVKN